MDWITVRRETRKASRIRSPEPESVLPVSPPRLGPSLIQRFIRRRIRLGLTQDDADRICGFPSRTVSAIESHRLYPTTDQLVAFDANLTVLEGRLEA